MIITAVEFQLPPPPPLPVRKKSQTSTTIPKNSFKRIKGQIFGNVARLGLRKKNGSTGKRRRKEEENPAFITWKLMEAFLERFHSQLVDQSELQRK